MSWGQCDQIWRNCATFGGLFGVWPPHALEQNFIVVNGQKLKNNLAIWLHFLGTSMRK